MLSEEDCVIVAAPQTKQEEHSDDDHSHFSETTVFETDFNAIATVEPIIEHVNEADKNETNDEMNSSHRATRANKKDNDTKQPETVKSAHTSTRRSATVKSSSTSDAQKQRLENVKIAKHTRKRLLDECEVTNDAKRIRTSSNASNISKSSERTRSNTNLSASKKPTELSPQSNKLHARSRKVSPNTNSNASTPQSNKPNVITNFFTRSRAKCSICSFHCESRNEIKFHMELHTKRRCSKCHEKFNNDIEVIKGAKTHVISCFRLDNKVPKEQLEKLLRGKWTVPVVRMTKKEIDKMIEDSNKLIANADANGDAENDDDDDEHVEHTSVILGKMNFLLIR